MAGAKLLQSTPESQFKVLVPWLILMAAALLLLQGPINRLFGVGVSLHLADAFCSGQNRLQPIHEGV